MKKMGLSLIENLQADGLRVFSLGDGMKRLKLSRKSVIEIVGRLKANRRVVALTSGLYALLHPSERKYGIRPLAVVDPLMKYRKTPYYVGLLSAADHWGAAEQKPMALQIVVPKQLNFRKAKDLNIRLHVKKFFPKKGIVTGKTETGYFNVSSPELTALDLLAYPHGSGGFDNICLVIQDLMEKMKVKELLSCSKGYGFPASVQRLGLILESYGAPEDLVLPIKKWIWKKRPSTVSLLPNHPREGRTHPEWWIVENVKIERER
jgi:predicted transcriptional regulator of viral defense system